MSGWWLLGAIAGGGLLAVLTVALLALFLAPVEVEEDQWSDWP
jgi:hypothetical protein